MTRRSSFALALALALALASAGTAPAQYFAENWSGLASGTTIVGRTASDGVSSWGLMAGNGSVSFCKGDGNGGVYIDQNALARWQCANTTSPGVNQVVTCSFVAPSGGVGGASQQIGLQLLSCDTGIYHGLTILLNAGDGATGSIGIYETSDVNSYTNSSTTPLNGATTTINCTLTLSAGTATLSLTGGVTATLTINLTLAAGYPGHVGIFGNTGAGIMTATTGWHLGPITATATTSAATLAKIAPARFPFYTGTPGQASKVPSAWYYNSTVAGFYTQSNLGREGNGAYCLCLDGVAPAGGVTFTPSPACTIITASGSGPTLTVPAGADAVPFTIVPGAGLTSNVTYTFTNDKGLTNPQALAIPIAPKLCVLTGDSETDESGMDGTCAGVNWVPRVRTAIGSAWLVKNTAKSSAWLSGGGFGAAYEVSNQQTDLWGPCHDAGRTQEAVIIWGGTNDLNGGTTGATVFSRLQGIVNTAKSEGWANIAVMTAMSRGFDSNQAGCETERQNFNSAVRSTYGSSGTDKSVAVLDVGNDANLGQPSSYSSTTYFQDKIHVTSAGGQIVADSYVTPYLQSLPATMAVIRGRLRIVPPLRGRTLSDAFPPARPGAPIDPQTFVPSPLKRKAA